MQVTEYLVIIKSPASAKASEREPQRATLSEDGTTFTLIREHNGDIQVGARNVKVIACITKNQ